MKKIMYQTLMGISIVVFLMWGVIRVFRYYEFKNNCGGYLTRAANANSIELAEENLTRAIEYLENNNLTSGQVSIFLRQPKNDITYWYKNLKSAQAQLQNINTDEISNLEESNILMKLRETLTENSSDGTILVLPEGIEIFPKNVAFLLWGVVSFVAIFVFGWRSTWV